MAEDWDLYAIVRAGYKSAATSSSAASETPSITATTTSSSEETLSCLANLTFNEENNTFSFPNLVQPRTSGFQELQQLFTSFTPTTTAATITAATVTSGFGRINSNSPFSDFSGCIGQQQQHQLHHHPRPPPPPPPPPPPVFSTTIHASIKPHFLSETSISGSERFHDQQQNQLQVVKQETQLVTPSGSAMSLQNTQAQPSTPRSRKRKSQQKRMVCHVTADNLSSDLWAWRKYGQKPIKGSPYPRNYYRCSSSKGCAARKQVERSTTEPDMFIVTYTGDHSHPRPTHRNSLAGSTRNKPSTTQKPVTYGSGSPSNPSSGPSSSSPLSPTSVPLRRPLTAQHEQGEAEDPISANETESPDPDMELNLGDDDDDDDEILRPNMQAAMADDVFFGIDQFLGDPGGSSGNPQVG